MTGSVRWGLKSWRHSWKCQLARHRHVPLASEPAHTVPAWRAAECGEGLAEDSSL